MQRITITLACFLIWVNCCSQQYPFVHYTPKDGLANSRVKKAYQDSKGRMYFLTYGGLSVYDGARFVNYSMQDGLGNNVVNDILEVGDDSLVVATNSSVVNVLVKGKIGKLETKGAGNVLVNQFYRSSGGKIFLSSDYGLYQMENNVVKELDISLMATANRGPFLSDLSCTGNYLVISINEMGDHKGLYLYDIINNSLCDGLKDLFIYLLGKDNHNYTWVFLHNKLFVLDNIAIAQGKLSLKEPPVPYVESKNYSTTNIAFDKNSIWFLYRNKDYRNTEIRRICDDGARLRMPLPAQATAADIKNIFLDKENTIWLSSDGEGVFKIVRSPMRIFQNPLGEANQSQVDYAYYSPSATWFGTNTKKLFRRSNNTLQQFNSNIEKPPVVFYDDGKKLLAHDRLNIYEAQLDDHSSIRFRKTITLPDSEFLDKKIMVDCNNNIIAGQKYSLSVWNHNKRVYQFPFDKNDVAEEIFLSKDKLLWIVTRFNGIYVFSVHPEDLPHYLQTVHRFPKQQIVGSPRSFVIDKTGMIWIGTRENGVSAYRETGDQLVLLHHLDASTGLTDNFVTSLACDSSNNIIVGTQTGLDRILRDKKDSCRIENLSKTSNFFALIKQSWAESGQAYAVTYAGALISISPAVSDGPSFTPQLFVEEMKVNASSTAIGQRQFPYNKNNISFSVAAPSFIDEDRVLYSYIVNASG